MARRRTASGLALASAFAAGAVTMLLIVLVFNASGRGPAPALVDPVDAPPRIEMREAESPARIGPDRPVVMPGEGHGETRTETADSSSEVLDDLRSRRLLIPLVGIAAGSLRSSFQEARSGGRAHEAIDILAPRHTPVRAVEDGVIEKLFLSKAGGVTVYQFDPARRFAYYYAHLDRYAPGLKEGDAVVRGQTLGYVGTTGNAPPDTPHLHFAIFRLTEAGRWWEGLAVDPFEVWKE
jgi:murein DD-endopeptidase MepM/ murein hydrolase activator NlpD